MVSPRPMISNQGAGTPSDNRIVQSISNLAAQIANPSTPYNQRQFALQNLQKLVAGASGQNTQAIQQALGQHGMTVRSGNIYFIKDGKIGSQVTPNGTNPRYDPLSSGNPGNPKPKPPYTGAGPVRGPGAGGGQGPGGTGVVPTATSGPGGHPAEDPWSSGIGATGTDGGGGGGVPGTPDAMDPGDYDVGTKLPPSDSYFKDILPGAIDQILPDGDPDSLQTRNAFNRYLNLSGTKDTYASEYLQDDFGNAEMVMRLLGSGDLDASMDGVDQMYGTQKLMDQMSTPGSGFINTNAMVDAMFEKAGAIQDPNMQFEYLSRSIQALKPYMGESSFRSLQARIGRQADTLDTQRLTNKKAGAGDWYDLLNEVM